jgi:hypothetical protein
MALPIPLADPAMNATLPSSFFIATVLIPPFSAPDLREGALEIGPWPHIGLLVPGRAPKVVGISF